MSALAPEVDVDIAQLFVDVFSRKTRVAHIRVENSLTDATLERTLDGASTLTLTMHDPKRVLLRSSAFGTADAPTTIETELNGLHWRLVKVGKSGDDLTLTFEDKQIAQLRTYTKPLHVSRSSMTRAEFALSLVREAKPPIPFVCPELHDVQAIVGSVGGKGGKADARKVRKALPYVFRRGGPDGVEDTWTCIQRLAEEVNWRCFASGGSVWFISETQLLKAKPTIDVDETSTGVVSIDFDMDAGKALAEATLVARANRWSAPPGAVVRLHDVGIADGLWLVHSTRRPVFAADAEISLKRATKGFAEPAPDSQSLSSPSASSSKKTKAAGVGGVIATVYDAAVGIDSKHYPYVWGGGHGSAGVPSGNPPGFDCSGSVVAVLAAAGLGYKLGGGTDVSGGIAAHWGVAGEGTQMTVWANAIHVFIIFHTKNGDVHWGTGDWGKGWGGAGFNRTLHPTSGFTPRHWPGT